MEHINLDLPSLEFSDTFFNEPATSPWLSIIDYGEDLCWYYWKAWLRHAYGTTVREDVNSGPSLITRRFLQAAHMATTPKAAPGGKKEDLPKASFEVNLLGRQMELYGLGWKLAGLWVAYVAYLQEYSSRDPTWQRHPEQHLVERNKSYGRLQFEVYLLGG